MYFPVKGRNQEGGEKKGWPFYADLADSLEAVANSSEGDLN